ncbi:hypothetical protein [Allosphingosinicella sp.]|jgi:hypothetical protein|uniref:hypothetical protein n=1 Tax=Allosphingosinicella sp. TaxID=2823234 RepID=UPI002F0469E9
MRAVSLIALGAAAFAIPASAQQDTAEDQAWYQALRGIARPCDDPVLDLPPPHVIRYRRESVVLARALLRVDAARCPGVAESTLDQLRARIGDPERFDVPLDVLSLASSVLAARSDPDSAALAGRYGRMLWLFSNSSGAHPGWPEAEREAWLREPATVALLGARNADDWLRTRRSVELHARLLLDSGFAGYDPAKAATLLETSQAAGIPGNRQRLVALLLDGDHLPPDYARASRSFVSLAAAQVDFAIEPQRELLRIGKLAAAAARTPIERAAALRILAFAALDGRFGSSEALSGMVASLGRVPNVALAEGDSERIGRALDFQFGFDLPDRREDDPAELRPIRLRGLIGPDGRIVATEIVQSSGVAHRDRTVRGVWAREGGGVDLSATAQGRFVWVDLPPVDPLLTTDEAYRRYNP